jgi:predicted phage terminase large subunit-like protein
MGRILTPKWTKYIPHSPTDPQRAFLLLDCKEALYGGAAGGGKSDAALMAALQYVDCPGYQAVIFRRQHTDLLLPDGLIPRSHEWLSPTDAHWNGNDKRWSFPSGATISFGYLQTEVDKYRYQGAAFGSVFFEELTQFTRSQYLYLFSRLRRPAHSAVPLRMRATANPGGDHHAWVHARFFTERAPRRVFIPARLEDNPFLDQQAYRESLKELDPVTRRQLELGDWNAKEAGEYFHANWFKVVDAAPALGPRRVRWWDLAATEAKPGTDPDWTVGLKLAEWKGQYWVEDVRRVRRSPAGVEDLVRKTAEADGLECEIHMEQEPGSSGVNTIDHYSRDVLKGYAFSGHRATGSKVERVKPASAAAEQRRISLVRGAWNTALLEELEAFPSQGVHDDQVDALGAAFLRIHQRAAPFTWKEPRVAVATGLRALEM